MGRKISRPLIIGLTGGIGSGKTTVCRLFENVGIPIIDADVIAREIVQPGKAAYQEIVATFGASILTEQQEIDRAKLRQFVFSDPVKLTQLEKITQPRIIKQMRMESSISETPYCIFCAPLLLELGLEKEVDRVLVIDITPDIQKQRVVQRDGVESSQVESIMKNQLGREERLAAADDIILNDGTIENLQPQVEQLHETYLELS